MKKGDPGFETWGSIDSARHGAGNVWIPAPTIRKPTCISSELAIRPRPTPIRPAATGDNLYTCSLVAINVDTGKMAWHYQFSRTTRTTGTH